jgi:response regulator RpfG family c-di-GMP phosphodiesterase
LLSRLSKLTIVQRIVFTYIITITVFFIYLLYSYNFTQNSINQLNKTIQQQLPISQLYSKNYELLEDIIGIFTDAVITNESDLVDSANGKKQLIIDNLKQIVIYNNKIDVENQKKQFFEYYNYAYAFTLELIKKEKDANLKDMTKLQELSKNVILDFEKQKELSMHLLVKSLEENSDKTSDFFNFSLFLAIITFIFMSISVIAMHSMLKSRFNKVIKSIKNLATGEPDFSIRLEIEYQDEIGEIMKWFNKLQSKFEIDYNHLNKLRKETEKSLEKEIEDTQKEVVFTMGAIGESRSKETGNHVRRVAEYSKLLALLAGIDMKNAELLKQASPMHDIGKVAIPDNILNKPARHTFNEFEIMKTHATIGYEMLKHSQRPLLQMAAIVALEHHEKWDGSGYPRGLKGEDINIYGRITAIADVYDALGSHRAYKEAWDDERIYALFREEQGKHFDPNLVNLFFDNIDEFLIIREKFKDIF